MHVGARALASGYRKEILDEIQTMMMQVPRAAVPLAICYVSAGQVLATTIVAKVFFRSTQNRYQLGGHFVTHTLAHTHTRTHIHIC